MAVCGGHSGLDLNFGSSFFTRSSCITGHDGLNRILHGYEDKTAYAQCIFAMTTSAEVEPKVFVGRTQGKVRATAFPQSHSGLAEITRINLIDCPYISARSVSPMMKTVSNFHAFLSY